MKKEGFDVGFVQIKLIHPFPTDYLKHLLSDDVENSQNVSVLLFRNFGAPEEEVFLISPFPLSILPFLYVPLNFNLPFL